MSEVGKVYLVGAGPGDPGLLTLKGLECLQNADLILYDGLVNPLLLLHTPADAQRTARSKSSGGSVLDQGEINSRLIDAARQGKTVVRLKGGDPFIFGRGSEEAAALAAAEIPYEVVPGITAATAGCEYAGISLTHREMASAVAFITGHEDSGKGRSLVDYDVFAKFPGTLVFYMGLHRLETIVERLIHAGKDRRTPACVVSKATTPAQRCVAAPLDELVDRVMQCGLRPPSLIVVGECVRQRDAIAWFERRPLFGKRIGITRPRGQEAAAVKRALELGAEPVLMPMIRILPPDDWADVDATLKTLHHIDWLIFTSANGVRGLLGRLWDKGGDLRQLARSRLAAIGPATAEALAEFHLKPDVVPGAFRAEALAAALGPHVAGKRVLWACANRGRDLLPAELTAAGARVERLVVYQSVDADSVPDAVFRQLAAGELDWIGLASPSMARNLAGFVGPAAAAHLGRSIKLASISPVTSAAAREANLPIAAEATVHTWDGLFDAIVLSETSAS